MGSAQSNPRGEGDSRSLPDHASLENLRKQAKCLHKLLKSGDAASVVRVRRHLPRLADTAEDEVADAGVTLQEVQHVIASEYGFGKWTDLVAAVSRDGVLPDTNPARMWRRSLPSYQYEAEIICTQVKAGDYWSLQRVRKHLPRLEDLSDEQLVSQGVTLEEARQIVATGANYGSFEELAADAGKLRPVNAFEDLADLDDGEVREMVWRVGRDDLAMALKTASEHFRERVRDNVSDDEWGKLVAQMEELRPVLASQVQMAQLAILGKFRSDDPVV